MSSFAIHPLDPDEIAALLLGAHADPFRVLGPHRAGDDLVVRVFRPEAKAVEVISVADHAQVFPAERLHIEGLYQATIPGGNARFFLSGESNRIRRLGGDAARSLQLRSDPG